MREFQLIFSDAGIMILILAVPILYPVLYSFIYYPEVVRDLPIAVVDMSQSSDSRKFTRELNATADLEVVKISTSMEEAIQLFKKRDIRGIVHIPSSFSKDIALNRQTTVSAYADMEFFLYYKALVSGVNFVALETGNQIQIKNLMNKGLTQHQAEVVANPIKLVGNSLVNQAGGFASYGIPAALILIIQQTLIIAIGTMAGTAREKHRFGTLIPLDGNRHGALSMVIGKSAAYFTIYALLSVYMLGMIPKWFGYPQFASFLELISLIIPFILSSIFMGMALSVLFKNRESAMLLYLVTSIPLLFLSGIIWPLANLDPIWLAVRDIFPSSNAIFGFIKMNSLGSSIFETRREILALWIQTGVYFLTALYCYAYHVKFSEKVRSEMLSQPVKDIRAKIAKLKASHSTQNT